MASTQPQSSTGANNEWSELRREHDLARGPMPLTTPRVKAATGNMWDREEIPPPPPTDEGPSPFVQEGVRLESLKAALVTQLDGSRYYFYVHKNSDGEVLFDMVAAQLELTEKDYFGLSYLDDQAIHHWLYKDKKIAKQVKQSKSLPWSFSFELKFYDPELSKLTGELTRHLVCLQLRNDIYTERLPVTFAVQAKLGALAAQIDFGDYRELSDEYEACIKSANIAPVVSVSMMERVAELHKQYRGLTPQEAESEYLKECMGLSLYGIWFFHAKDSKGKAVQVGVSAHGLSVYNDQMREHRFAWPNINRFSFRSNVFSIRLNAGELGPKEKTVTYKLPDYATASRLFKCGVEHHTFFRLTQPGTNERSMFKCRSKPFQYQGRTKLQTEMASQLFGSSATHPIERGIPGSKSADNVKHPISVGVHNEQSKKLLRKGSATGAVGPDGDEVGGPASTTSATHYYVLHHERLHHARHPVSSNVPSPTAITTNTSTQNTDTTHHYHHHHNLQKSQVQTHAQPGIGVDLQPQGVGYVHNVTAGENDQTMTSATVVTSEDVSSGGADGISSTRRIITTTTTTTRTLTTSAKQSRHHRHHHHQHRNQSVSSNSSSSSYSSALDDALLPNDSGYSASYEASESAYVTLGVGSSARLQATSPSLLSKSITTTRVTSPSYALNSSLFDESQLSPYEGERLSSYTIASSGPSSTGVGAERSQRQKVRFLKASGARGKSPLKFFAKGSATERASGAAGAYTFPPPRHTSFPMQVEPLWKWAEVPVVPIGNLVQVYNNGIYTTNLPVAANQLGETHTFTLLPKSFKKRAKKGIPTSEKIQRQSRAFDGTLDYVVKAKRELEYVPLRYCVACYHSGYSRPPWRLRGVHIRHGGKEDVVETSKLDLAKHYTPLSTTVPCLDYSRLEREHELETSALRYHVSPYPMPAYRVSAIAPISAAAKRGQPGISRASERKADGGGMTVGILHLKRPAALEEPIPHSQVVRIARTPKEVGTESKPTAVGGAALPTKSRKGKARAAMTVGERLRTRFLIQGEQAASVDRQQRQQQEQESAVNQHKVEAEPGVSIMAPAPHLEHLPLSEEVIHHPPVEMDQPVAFSPVKASRIKDSLRLKPVAKLHTKVVKKEEARHLPMHDRPHAIAEEAERRASEEVEEITPVVQAPTPPPKPPRGIEAAGKKVKEQGGGAARQKKLLAILHLRATPPEGQPVDGASGKTAPSHRQLSLAQYTGPLASLDKTPGELGQMQMPLEEPMRSALRLAQPAKAQVIRPSSAILHMKPAKQPSRAMEYKKAGAEGRGVPSSTVEKAMVVKHQHHGGVYGGGYYYKQYINTAPYSGELYSMRPAGGYLLREEPLAQRVAVYYHFDPSSAVGQPPEQKGQRKLMATLHLKAPSPPSPQLLMGQAEMANAPIGKTIMATAAAEEEGSSTAAQQEKRRKLMAVLHLKKEATTPATPAIEYRELVVEQKKKRPQHPPPPPPPPPHGHDIAGGNEMEQLSPTAAHVMPPAKKRSKKRATHVGYPTDGGQLTCNLDSLHRTGELVAEPISMRVSLPPSIIPTEESRTMTSGERTAVLYLKKPPREMLPVMGGERENQPSPKLSKSKIPRIIINKGSFKSRMDRDPTAAPSLVNYPQPSEEYSGPMAITGAVRQLEQLPLSELVNAYHPGDSWWRKRGKPPATHITPTTISTVITASENAEPKKQVAILHLRGPIAMQPIHGVPAQPSSPLYQYFDTAPYVGQLASMRKVPTELGSKYPIADHSTIYHQGASVAIAPPKKRKWEQRAGGEVLKTRQALERKQWQVAAASAAASAIVDSARETTEARPPKATATLYLKAREHPSLVGPPPPQDIASPNQPIHPAAATTTTGEGKRSTAAPTPHQTLITIIKRQRYYHSSSTTTATLINTERYTGPMESLSRVKPLDTNGIGEHVNVYYAGDISQASASSPIRHAKEKVVAEEEVPSPQKSLAILHLRHRQVREEEVAKNAAGPADGAVESVHAPSASHVKELHKPAGILHLKSTPAAAAGGVVDAGKKKRKRNRNKEKRREAPTEPSQKPASATGSQQDKSVATLHMRAETSAKVEAEKQQAPSSTPAPIVHKVVVKKRVSYPVVGAPYSGPLTQLTPRKQLESHPLFNYVAIYHAGHSYTSPPQSPIAKERVAEQQPSPKAGKLRATLHLEKEKWKDTKDTSYPAMDAEAAYTGPLSMLAYSPEMKGELLTERVALYHSGKYSLPHELANKGRPATASPERQPEQASSSETTAHKLMATLHLKSTKRAKEAPMPHELADKGRPATAEQHEASSAKAPAHKLMATLHLKHTKPAEVMEAKEEPIPLVPPVVKRVVIKKRSMATCNHYPKIDPTAAYDGPLSMLAHSPEMKGGLLTERVALYHPGVYSLPRALANKDRPATVPPEPQPEQQLEKASPSEAAAHKLMATLHLKPTKREEAEVMEEKEEPMPLVPPVVKRLVIKKRSMATGNHYPKIDPTAAYDGPLSMLAHSPEMRGEPLRERVALYHPGVYSLPRALVNKDRPATVPPEPQPEQASPSEAAAHKLMATLHLKPTKRGEVMEAKEEPMPHASTKKGRPSIAEQQKASSAKEPAHKLMATLHLKHTERGVVIEAKEPTKAAPMPPIGSTVQRVIIKRRNVTTYTRQPKVEFESAYVGPLSSLSPAAQMPRQPMPSSVAAYHLGYYTNLLRTQTARYSSTESTPPQSVQAPEPSRLMATLHLKRARQEATIKGEELPEMPLPSVHKVGTRRKETGKSSYPVVGAAYDGPLTSLTRCPQLETRPLSDHVAIYHLGQYATTSTRLPQMAKEGQTTQPEVQHGRLPASVPHRKPMAILHLKAVESGEKMPEHEEAAKGSPPSLAKQLSLKKNKGAIDMLHYPQMDVSAAYHGPLTPLSPSAQMAGESLPSSVTVYHQGHYAKLHGMRKEQPAELTEPTPASNLAMEQYKLLATLHLKKGKEVEGLEEGKEPPMVASPTVKRAIVKKRGSGSAKEPSPSVATKPKKMAALLHLKAGVDRAPEQPASPPTEPSKRVAALAEVPKHKAILHLRSGRGMKHGDGIKKAVPVKSTELAEPTPTPHLVMKPNKPVATLHLKRDSKVEEKEGEPPLVAGTTVQIVRVKKRVSGKPSYPVIAAEAAYDGPLSHLSPAPQLPSEPLSSRVAIYYFGKSTTTATSHRTPPDINAEPQQQEPSPSVAAKPKKMGAMLHLKVGEDIAQEQSALPPTEPSKRVAAAKGEKTAVATVAEVPKHKAILHLKSGEGKKHGDDLKKAVPVKSTELAEPTPTPHLAMKSNKPVGMLHLKRGARVEETQEEPLLVAGPTVQIARVKKRGSGGPSYLVIAAEAAYDGPLSHLSPAPQLPSEPLSSWVAIYYFGKSTTTAISHPTSPSINSEPQQEKPSPSFATKPKKMAVLLHLKAGADRAQEPPVSSPPEPFKRVAAAKGEKAAVNTVAVLKHKAMLHLKPKRSEKHGDVKVEKMMHAKATEPPSDLAKEENKLIATLHLKDRKHVAEIEKKKEQPLTAGPTVQIVRVKKRASGGPSYPVITAEAAYDGPLSHLSPASQLPSEPLSSWVAIYYFGKSTTSPHTPPTAEQQQQEPSPLVAPKPKKMGALLHLKSGVDRAQEQPALSPTEPSKRVAAAKGEKTAVVAAVVVPKHKAILHLRSGEGERREGGVKEEAVPVKYTLPPFPVPTEPFTGPLTTTAPTKQLAEHPISKAIPRLQPVKLSQSAHLTGEALSNWVTAYHPGHSADVSHLGTNDSTASSPHVEEIAPERVALLHLRAATTSSEPATAMAEKKVHRQKNERVTVHVPRAEVAEPKMAKPSAILHLKSEAVRTEAAGEAKQLVPAVAVTKGKAHWQKKERVAVQVVPSAEVAGPKMAKPSGILHLKSVGVRGEATKEAKQLVPAVLPVGYPAIDLPYTGALASTSPAPQLRTEPLPNSVCVYHPGHTYSVVIKRAPTHVSAHTAAPIETSKRGGSIKKSLAVLHLKSSSSRKQPREGHSEAVVNGVTDASPPEPFLPTAAGMSEQKALATIYLKSSGAPVAEEGQEEVEVAVVAPAEIREASPSRSAYSWLWWQSPMSTVAEDAPAFPSKAPTYEGPITPLRRAKPMDDPPLGERVEAGIPHRTEEPSPSDLHISTSKAIVHLKTETAVSQRISEERESPLAVAKPLQLKQAKQPYVPSRSWFMMEPGAKPQSVVQLSPTHPLPWRALNAYVALYEQKPYQQGRQQTSAKPYPEEHKVVEVESRLPRMTALLHLKKEEAPSREAGSGSSEVSEASPRRAAKAATRTVVSSAYTSIKTDRYLGYLASLSPARQLNNLPIGDYILLLPPSPPPSKTQPRTETRPAEKVRVKGVATIFIQPRKEDTQGGRKPASGKPHAIEQSGYPPLAAPYSGTLAELSPSHHYLAGEALGEYVTVNAPASPISSPSTTAAYPRPAAPHKQMAILYMRKTEEASATTSAEMVAHEVQTKLAQPVRKARRIGERTAGWIRLGPSLFRRGSGELITPIAQVSQLEKVDSTMKTSSVEMPLVNDATMEVELRRVARVDYACDAFLTRRTRRFHPPALTAPHSEAAYDGPAFLPKSLFKENGTRGTSSARITLTIHHSPSGGGATSEQEGTSHPAVNDENSPGEVKDQPSNLAKHSRGKEAKDGGAGNAKNKRSAGATKEGKSLTSSKKVPSNKASNGSTTTTAINNGTVERAGAAKGSGWRGEGGANKFKLAGSHQASSPPTVEGIISSNFTAESIAVEYHNNQQSQQHQQRTASSSSMSILATLRRRLSQTMGTGHSRADKKAAKEEEKAKKEKAKRTKKGGVDVSSTSLSTSPQPSDVEAEHMVTPAGQHQCPPAKPARGSITEANRPTMMNGFPTMEDLREHSAGPYTPAKDSTDGKVIREEKLEQIYRIVGNGKRMPKVDPQDASLSGTILRYVRESQTTPNVNMLVEDVVVKEKSPLSYMLKEASLPHSTTQTWHESTVGPETVTTEVDEQGNVIRRTLLKSEQIRHTVQTQSYQTFKVDESSDAPLTTSTPVPPTNGEGRGPMERSMHSHTVAYENGVRRGGENKENGDWTGELVSTKAVTTGNRTVETLTFKKEKDGVVETRVEHRITIHSGDNVDHDEELSRAILEATNMNPHLNVEKVDYKRESQER